MTCRLCGTHHAGVRLPVSVRTAAVGTAMPAERTAGSAEPGSRAADGYTPHVHFLFVCTANICRSPMAAALFAEQIQRLPDPVEVSSAGISATGSWPDRRCPTRCSR